MSSTSNHNIPHHQNNNICNNTTFVQADPSNFRSVVQKLTGHESDKLPSVVGKSNSGVKTLHERRHSATKLENIFTGNKTTIMCTRKRIISSNFLASPVSHLEMLTSGISPRSTEERAIAEKRFCLHPTTPTASQPPKLLPLFPLYSPATVSTHHSSSS
ncbi:VQ motif-containing protein 11-like [Solanum dulcamara]|uniref:VQ motif-containing protein 11-like n=1 Tax=Solanum dulcamara TaxID=45834 RepID=UPI0024864E1F|nr:VQ motif-containing protein 11-like [Solanum dulcamara]